MTMDPESELRRWYRDSLRERIGVLEGLLKRAADGDRGASGGIRAAAHALRGSGGTYGYPQISLTAELLENGEEGSLVRRLEGFLVVLRSVASPDSPEAWRRFDWLGRAVDGVPPPASDLDEAWRAVARSCGVDAPALAERVARRYGLTAAGGLERHPDPGILPRNTARLLTVVPVKGADGALLVATADPTDVEAEAVLERVVRRPFRLLVADPGLIRSAAVALGD